MTNCQKTVAVFNNETYVRYQPGNRTFESSSVQMTLVERHYNVLQFAGDNAEDFMEAGEKSDAILIPALMNMETPPDVPPRHFSERVVAAIQKYVVEDGGGVIFMGRGKNITEFNRIFGTDMRHDICALESETLNTDIVGDFAKNLLPQTLNYWYYCARSTTISIPQDAIKLYSAGENHTGSILLGTDKLTI